MTVMECVTYNSYERKDDKGLRMNEKNVKTVLEGNSFYEIDLNCKREKESRKGAGRNIQRTSSEKKKRQRN